MRWLGGAPQLDLDWPVPGAAVAGGIEVVGWAFSRRAPIARVEAQLGDGAPVRLGHGLPRADVAAAHGCDPACGFAGVVPLDGLASGPATLTVAAIDAKGRRCVRRASVVVVTSGPTPDGRLEIEQVEARGAELLLEGIALAPPGIAWRTVRLEVDAASVGSVRHGLSRPELAGRFPGCLEALRSGFRFRGRVPARGQLRLAAETSDGRRLERDVPRPVLAGVGPAGDALDVPLERLRDELGRDPTLLDATGFGLAASLPGESVATPLDPRVLPYADRSFDLVAVADGAPERLAQVRRLSSRGVLQARSGGGWSTLWQAAPDPLSPPQPRVSVVIPVFNQRALTDACLERVLATWPGTLPGEVLVVDDASTDDTPQLLEHWCAHDTRVRVLRQPDNRGFVAACNAGAAAAVGDLLVFLNNDTLPLPGWLPPLVAALARDRVGAVGGKLLYPDGTLQEAGGVIFSDGDGCNFGKGDAFPDYPLFEHVREVDYCSGALLATPRALFLAQGGFDVAYAPGYYEDADYAFRLRAQGYRVCYQPASAVVHLEGATAGRDLASGMKQYQVRNRATFRARWAAALAEQPLPPGLIDRGAMHRLHVRGRDTRRALVVLPTMPEPDREGGSRRAFHLIELLVEAGWALSVLVENGAGGERYARTLRQLGAATYVGHPTRWAGADYLPDLAPLVTAERFDLALVAFWHLAERHLPLLRARSPSTRVVIDSIDLHFLRMARGAFGKARLERRPDALDGRYADELRRELNAYGAADAVLTVSDKEAGWVDDLVGLPGQALCVALMEDSPRPARPLEERRGLLFLGNFRHPPNVDALAFLADVVARLDPALLAAHPLAIVGNGLTTAILGPLAGHPHVDAVGWVPAVEPYLERARMSLVPLRHGAGTKAKLLQSLFAGTPCVSTSVGIEGYGLRDGREVLVADALEPFVAAILRLAGDDETWRQLSRDGRDAAVRAHGRDTVRRQFQAALETVLARAAR